MLFRSVRRARPKWLIGHAECNAIGSWGRGRRTSYPIGSRAESQPLRKGHADHAPPSGETTGFRDAFWFFSKVQSSPKPKPLVPCKMGCVMGRQLRRWTRPCPASRGSPPLLLSRGPSCLGSYSGIFQKDLDRRGPLGQGARPTEIGRAHV